MPLKNLVVLFFLITFSLVGCGDSSSSSSRTESPSTTFPDPVPNNPVTGFSLSGTIFVASNTTKDDDVNDVNTRLLTNDEPTLAQQIPIPAILGGYVNQAGAGPVGNLKISGDRDDFYQADLRAGERILLFVANENLFGNDLDLGLLNEQGEVLDASVGEGRAESLIVPVSGRYFIQVQAHLGASNYILSIGQNFSTTSQGMRLSNEFAPNQAIMQFSSDKNVLQAQTVLNAFEMQTESKDTSRRRLFEMNPNRLHTLANSSMKFATPDLRTKYETLMAIKTLRRTAGIVEVSPNYQLQAFRTPNDELYRYQWNHVLMNLPQAWDTTIGDSSVIVAVIDTGVLLDHPDLQGQLVNGFDFIGDPKIEVDGSGGIDANPNDPGDQFPGGSTFHGTHVSGTVAAATNNREGVAGVSWLTKIMPLRTLGQGGIGYDYDIEQAMRYAAGLPNDSGRVPARRADIMNVSLGGPAISPGFQQVVNEVRNAGVMVVAASGNENTNQPMYPASLNGVISVGAVNIYSQRASYSNYGPTLDVMAPGGDSTPDVNGDGMPDGIISTIGDDQRSGQFIQEYAYRSLEGTSMASPHVAGIISLMKAVNPNLMPQDFDSLLTSGKITDDLGRAGRDDEFGYGLLNAQKAVLAAAELSGSGISLPASPLLVVNPQSLNFGLSQIRATLRLNNGGSGDLFIENIYEDSGGFLFIEGNGLGDYVVTVDRSVLNIGTYTATITIITNANSVQIPVILQVGDPNSTGDAGLHYVLLIEPNSLNTVQQTSAFVQNGTYAFQFDNIPIGTYIIAAGTDFNNDGYICDVGEACGFFPTSEKADSIEVSTNQSNLDFSTGFNVNFISQLSHNEEVAKPPRGFALLKPKQLGNR